MREEGEGRGQEWSVRKRWARIGSERDRDRGARERERGGREREWRESVVIERDENGVNERKG